MRKQMIRLPQSAPAWKQCWLDVNKAASVGVSSEDENHPMAFEEREAFRTQEFVLRWASHVGRPFQEIVRQQWNFSSPGGVREIEDFAVDLFAVGVIELIIVADKSGGEARASLVKMCLR